MAMLKDCIHCEIKASKTAFCLQSGLMSNLDSGRWFVPWDKFDFLSEPQFLEKQVAVEPYA